MAKVTRRKDKIIALVHERGEVSVVTLAERLGVSMQTIRRDLDDLCGSGLLMRRHGAVASPHQPVNAPYDQRAATNPDYKWAIARAVAAEIPDGSSLFISIGTTPTIVAEALKSKKNLTVITNNLNAAMVLASELSNRIIIPGGEIRLPDRDLIGQDAIAFFDRYRADFGIFGVAGVAIDGTLLDFHAAEVAIRETIRTHSSVSLLVVDSSKFGRIAPAAGGNILEVDKVFMDRHSTEDFAPVLEQVNNRLVLVGGEVV